MPPAIRRFAAAIGAGLFAVAAQGAASPAAEPKTGPATVSGFQLSGGFNKDGWKTWDISGKQMQMASSDAQDIDITDLKLRMFSGGEDLAVETTIESPQATVVRGANQTHSPGFILITGASYQVTGNDWSWDGGMHVIHVNHNVVVKFSPAATAGHITDATAKPSKPITVQSDKLEIRQNPGRNEFLFSGSVYVSDGDCDTRCQTLDVIAIRDVLPGQAPVATAKSGGAMPAGMGVGHIERIVARGRVISRQHSGNLEASGDVVDLTPGEEKVVLSGAPQVRDFSSDAILQGSRITWWRHSDQVQVEPATGPDGLSRVRISLPQLARYQDGAPAGPAAADASRLIITGEALTANFSAAQRRFDLERSVRVADPQLTVDAEHLDAEFDQPAAAPSSGPVGLSAAPNAQIGSLKHLTASGNVGILQTYRRTTTQQAEIFPQTGRIVLTGSPHIEDSFSHAVVEGSRMTLFTDAQRALIESAPGHPVEVTLSSLPKLDEAAAAPGETHIRSDSLSMLRGSEFSTFSFEGNVSVDGHEMSVTCGVIDAFTRNPVGADAAGDDLLGGTGQVGDIIRLVAHNHVEINQGDYKAQAARAEIFPRTGVSEDSGNDTSTAKPYRFVQLYGDPAGLEGPVRPTVILPSIGNLGWDFSGEGNTTPAPAGNATIITSDEQKLLTSPAGNVYLFSGNVQIQGSDIQASCDEMRVEAGTGNATAATGPNAAPVPFAIRKIVGAGNVRIVQGTRVATAGQADILPADGKIILSKNPEVTDVDGVHSENVGTIELRRGERRIYINPQAIAPGTPGQRMRFILPPIFDKSFKPADKAPASGSH